MRMNGRFFLTLFLLISSCGFAQEVMRCENARVEFVSEAPLELISAVSEECVGVLDLERQEFAFRVRIRSFEGFNSPLQKEHFNENYMESEKYAFALFEGRFIEALDIGEAGRKILRVKGGLTAHGVKHERVLDIAIIVSEQGEVFFESDFEVALARHEIEVPRIVYQKISEVIVISVKGSFR